MALLLASRRAVISRHPTLWSPDFPLRTVRTIVKARFFRTQRLSGRLPGQNFTPWIAPTPDLFHGRMEKLPPQFPV